MKMEQIFIILAVIGFAIFFGLYFAMGTEWTSAGGLVLDLRTASALMVVIAIVAIVLGKYYK